MQCLCCLSVTVTCRCKGTCQKTFRGLSLHYWIWENGHFVFRKSIKNTVSYGGRHLIVFQWQLCARKLIFELETGLVTVQMPVCLLDGHSRHPNWIETVIGSDFYNKLTTCLFMTVQMQSYLSKDLFRTIIALVDTRKWSLGIRQVNQEYHLMWVPRCQDKIDYIVNITTCTAVNCYPINNVHKDNDVPIENWSGRTTHAIVPARWAFSSPELDRNKHWRLKIDGPALNKIQEY